MTQVTARVHLQPVHLANVGQCQAVADPQTRPTDLGYESAYGQVLLLRQNIQCNMPDFQTLTCNRDSVPLLITWLDPGLVK